MSGKNKDMLEMFGEHKFALVMVSCLCLSFAVYCLSTAGASSFGDTCHYAFQCADLVQYDLVCREVSGEDRCVIMEDDGNCPNHTRHEDGACLPIEGMRTVGGRDRIAPNINGPSSALGEN